jgi:hypothetical protein
MNTQWVPIEVKGKCPALLIDNWYNKEEEILIWNELNFLNNSRNLLRSENTVTAQDDLGNSKSSSFRIYMEEIYNNRNYSNIFFCMYKQQTKQFHSLLEKALPMGRVFKDTTHSSSLISYYEENDYYKEHYDVFLFTCLIWFYKEPKSYEGGDFSFTESDTIISSKHNRMCIFPSFYLHQVNPIKWLNPNKNKGYGRYTITHFFYTNPIGVNE